MKRIGFFHFGRNHNKPLQALETSLKCSEVETPEALTEALVVLPEAFNIGVKYRESGIRNFDRAILKGLQHFSNDFRLTFVAGLVIEEPNCPYEPPFSGAYVIRPNDEPFLMCHKVTDDGSNANYTSARTAYEADHPIIFDIHNPAQLGERKVGVLICLDATPSPGRSMVSGGRRPKVDLNARVTQVVQGSEILCIPAHMSAQFFNGARVGGTIDPQWKGTRVVLANSDPSGARSFVTDAEGTILRLAIAQDECEVVTIPI